MQPKSIDTGGNLKAAFSGKTLFLCTLLLTINPYQVLRLSKIEIALRRQRFKDGLVMRHFQRICVSL